MLFDPSPKEHRKDFFDNEVLINSLSEKLGDKYSRCIAILGPRRTGKTSLMKVTLNGMKVPYVFIDARSVESKHDFFNKLSRELSGIFRDLKISAIELGARVEFGKKGDIAALVKERKFILAVDEAQLLGQFGLAPFLAYVYDNAKGVKLLFSGSEVGTLYRFLGKDDPGNPFFGRAIEFIKTRRLAPEEGRNFLSIGGKETGRHISEEEIADAIRCLDGIIGWLTLYGWQRRENAHQKALDEVVRQGKLLTQQEFQNFVSAKKARRKYEAIIRAVARGKTSWTGIKETLEAELGYPTSDSQLADYISTLTDHEFIYKDKEYGIVDPLLKMAFE